MRTAIRAITLAAAVMLAAPGAGATQVGDFMKVHQDVWTNINRFVFLVALDANAGPENPEYQRRSALASWDEVYAASQQWARETFPAVQQLAAELAKDDIGSNLEVMQQAADAIAQGHGDNRAKFETAATAVEGRIETLSAITATTKGQIERLVQANQAVRREYQQLEKHDLGLLQIEIRAEHASRALRTATMAWSILQSDVKELRRVVDAAQKVDPDLYTLMSKSRWMDIARDAKGFMTDMKKQEQYLTGEDYYGNCGVKDGWPYMLEGGNNKFLVSRFGSIISVDDISGFNPVHIWIFNKTELGWWRVYNVAEGYNYALVGGAGGAGLSRTSDPTSSHFWRTLPISEGRCRLVNSFLGADYSLEARNGTFPPGGAVTLEKTTETEGQQWTWIGVGVE